MHARQMCVAVLRCLRCDSMSVVPDWLKCVRIELLNSVL